MKDDTIFLQEAVHKAWVAKDNVLYKGWILRLSEGITKRANSVLTLRYFGDNVAADIENVETIYRSRDLPVIFQIADYHQPENIMGILESLGYHPCDETIVMNRNLKEFKITKWDSKISYTTEVGVADYWFETLERLSTSSSTRILGIRSIVDRCTFGKITCYAQENKEIIGTVLGIIEADNLGIYNLIVNPDRRREGIGEKIMLKVMNWAQENGIKSIYLAVEKSNLEALALYRKLGFDKKYCYRYYEKDE
ncbi:MAG: GNAT family N-acetyltransferase [Candidatus Heimdallarchaeota archaeon]|nr:GNAT family N-acetyltransferase [Candidatus Heimdallarchaeota archaeon]